MCARDVLLIDEMSLITPNMLADIDRALKKATRCEHDFGNWLVILSGDFFQINDDVQYHNHTANGARWHFTITLLSLYHHLTIT